MSERADDNYISWDNTQNEHVTLTGASLENDGASIGSTGSSTVATFAIGNSTQQDYVLTFKTAANNLTAELEVTLTNSSSTKVLDKVAQVKNTSSWYFDGTETTHSFLISQLPKGNYTLKIATKSTTGKYAGNWGYLAFRAASNYDVIPGTLDLSKGTYSYNKMLENNGTNVGYIENGRTASYSFVNNTAGTYKMTMDIYRYNQGGTMNILIEDAETGAAEVNYDYTIAADAPGSYTATDIPLPTAINNGLKRMTLTFSNGDSYICNYKAPTFTLVEQQPATVTTGAIGWVTACLTYDAQVPEGTKAYYISAVTNDAVTLTELTAVPAGEGFIFNAPQGSHEFQKATDTPAAISNLLVGTLAPITVAANSIYVLGKNSQNKAAMMLYTGTSLAAGKAYLPASAVPSGVNNLRFAGVDLPTDISEIENGEWKIENEVYDLQGRRMKSSIVNSQSSTLKRGVYIVSGRLIVK